MGVIRGLWAGQVKPEGEFVLHPWDLVPTELHVLNIFPQAKDTGH